MANMRICFVFVALVSSFAFAGTKVTLDENGVMEIDSKKTFVFSFSLPPPPGGKTPEGGDAFAELKDAGVNCMRTGPTPGPEEFSESGSRTIKAWLDEGAIHQMHCCIPLGKLRGIESDKPQNEKLLRMAIEMYKD